MAEKPQEEQQRWTAKRRVALVLSILKGETSVQEAARKHGLKVAGVEDWRDRFLVGAENALRFTAERRGGCQGRADREAEAENRRPRSGQRHPKGGDEGSPFGPEDIGRVRTVLPNASRANALVDEVLSEHLRRLIVAHPTFGYRRLWALLRFRDDVRVNRKTVYRILSLKCWFVHQRQSTPRPRVRGKISRADRSNERWAMDVTQIDCGIDGWAHLAAIIDCHDRELIGYELALRARANQAERALEAACIDRFVTLRPDGSTPVIRSDNGLIFQSRRFRAACRDYRLTQEYITPYTPEQNGMIERFFRSLKEECVWQHNFTSFSDARAVAARWIDWYNESRPHPALGYRSPRQFRAQQLPCVA